MVEPFARLKDFKLFIKVRQVERRKLLASHPSTHKTDMKRTEITKLDIHHITMTRVHK